jgi:hypothetical protein
MVMLFCTVLAFGQSGPSIDDILNSLAKYSDHFEQSLPDFVTTETFTQELYKSDGKLLEKNVTISLLAGRQIRTEKKGHIELGFKELRQVQNINGKPVKATELKLSGTQVGGAFSAILLSHFATGDQRDYQFSLESEIATVRNRPAYVLTFITRADRSKQFYLFDGKSLESRQHGRAWIDTETLTPLRIEYNELNLPKGIKSMFYAVDYSAVDLGNETFTLPIAAIAEIGEGKAISKARHEYQDYRRFSTDVEIESK